MLLATKMIAAAKAAHRVYPQYLQPEMERYCQAEARKAERGKITEDP